MQTTPWDLVREELLAAPPDVKIDPANPLNLRQLVLRSRRKDLGPQPPRPVTSATTYVIADATTGHTSPTDPPLPFLKFNELTSAGKRVLVWISPTFLTAINNREDNLEDSAIF